MLVLRGFEQFLLSVHFNKYFPTSELRMLLEDLLEDLDCDPDIPGPGMRRHMRFPTIELVCRRQVPRGEIVSWNDLVVQDFRIKNFFLREIEVLADGREFTAKKREVESEHIESADIHALEHAPELVGKLHERRFVRDVLVTDSVDTCRFCRNGTSRIDAIGLRYDLSRRHDLLIGYLYDTVGAGRKACRLEIEDDERPIQLEIVGDGRTHNLNQQLITDNLQRKQRNYRLTHHLNRIIGPVVSYLLFVVSLCPIVYQSRRGTGFCKPMYKKGPEGAFAFPSGPLL